MLRAAFRDAHGARLNGFALIVTLGDQALAASLAADALGEGTRHASALRHPERAAAWLRAHVLKAISPRLPRRSGLLDRERRAALEAIGVDSVTFGTLASLSVGERVALVAGSLEGFEPLDLEVILGLSPRAASRRAAESRRKFFERHVAVDHARAQTGPLGTRVREITDQALARKLR